MGCSDVSKFEHIYGQLSTRPSCVYDPLFTRTRIMVVNALIVWKKLTTFVFLIKSSLLALTAAYAKFRRMIGSMIWSCVTFPGVYCYLIVTPVDFTGEKLKAYNFLISRMGQVTTGVEAQFCLSFQRCVQLSFVLKSGQASASIRYRTKCGLLYTLTERPYCLLICQCLMA